MFPVGVQPLEVCMSFLREAEPWPAYAYEPIGSQEHACVLFEFLLGSVNLDDVCSTPATHPIVYDFFVVHSPVSRSRQAGMTPAGPIS